MKSLIAALIITLSLPAISFAESLTCDIGSSYQVVVDLKSNSVAVWDLSDLSQPLRTDVISKQEEGINVLTLRLQTYGTFRLEFTNEDGSAEGDWNHKGLLDQDLYKESRRSLKGKTFVSNCFAD